MRVPIPHRLEREEVRRRLRDNSHRMADAIPGGMAQVDTSWPSEDRMTMAISAMGQALNGHIDIEDQQVVFEIDLPPALGFLTPMIEGAIQQQGQKMLEGPRD
ncbi:MAG: polyhydroxyalkanoic acid system family protein [Erythrobacter sp.]|nr:polyhydroxyalkanoic acid system family protein [Erythrobacter sp.]